VKSVWSWLVSSRRVTSIRQHARSCVVGCDIALRRAATAATAATASLSDIMVSLFIAFMVFIIRRSALPLGRAADMA
jgi:hypothetical protein